ncbi:hypothetical protein [Thioalkalivibrio paradoxus]|uniref:Uncharacterized protein n=1 Tax=Thioalkalivibrio paradoxus ARh 1 TaxID=713585 RepID=W0DP87_9GAMM|nr:hypothetical protein [Thioalkalivibrio paradoxus]AHF00267.1 hypothetical protein THITH_15035 [Thioalkalivibrio paradoxus ARh 1]
MGSSIDGNSASLDRRSKGIMGQVDCADYGIDVDAIGKGIERFRAEVPEGEGIALEDRVAKFMEQRRDA